MSPDRAKRLQQRTETNMIIRLIDYLRMTPTQRAIVKSERATVSFLRQMRRVRGLA